MDSNTPKWLIDLLAYADSIPYGEATAQVKRVNRKTVEVVTVGEESLRYTDNQEALQDIYNFIASLLDAGHTGDVQFTIDTKDGQIRLLKIKNTTRTSY